MQLPQGRHVRRVPRLDEAHQIARRALVVELGERSERTQAHVLGGAGALEDRDQRARSLVAKSGVGAGWHARLDAHREHALHLVLHGALRARRNVSAERPEAKAETPQPAGHALHADSLPHAKTARCSPMGC